MGFAVDSDYLQYVAQHDRSPHRWDVLAAGQPPALQYWYRLSPRPLVSSHVTGRVYPNNPPVVESFLSLQNHGTPVWFRNLKVRRASR